ncbi:hypothetical protein [Phenylobacterium soli]|uniref:Uncharacterized protein n=1 Tax=Phenylobacterium soli TaxID=2170551 RepID=A0A328AFM1_9CAUL|nr:hypothetical protein [Phenylobacterium soli]RAK51598.1 hypothetical protein DJ017_17330 [Phenylobacterium soli]
MAQAAPDQQAEDPAKKLKDAQCARKWIAELTLSEKAQQKWLTRARKIVQRYKQDNRADTDQRRFAMLWSNTQTIQPAVYARPPQPVVSRRFGDADPVARAASEILERAIAYSIDCQDLDGRLRQCSLDYVLVARGQTWERYVPTHGPMVTPEIELQVVTSGDGDEDEGESTDDDQPERLYTDENGTTYDPEQVKFREDGSAYAEGEPYEPVVYEESVTDYVNWEDFGHSVARTWDEVDYVWRRVYLNRSQLIERFGEDLGKRIPLDWGVRNAKGDAKTVDDAELSKKAAVYEIWCKSEEKVYWISKSFSEAPLDVRDDPLELDGFFPCPRPLLGTTGNDSTIPVPDFALYQDQAQEIDKLTARIAHLQDALKVRGFYAGDQKNNLNNLLNSDSNMLIPVPDWVSLKEDGGIRGKIDWFPIDLVVSALQALINQRAQLINDVYQITGIADILRGMNDPRATATAEALKGQWGTLRIRDRQLEMMRFARDILRIKGQVIAEKFDPDTLKQMTGVQLPTNADKQQAQLTIQQGAMQYQQAVMQAQATGQPPPPQPEIPDALQQVLRSPSWEDVTALLRNNALRQFRIDIETDSTVEPNEQQEKAQFVEFIGALGQMVQQWGPAVEAQPALAPVAAAVVKAGVRKFRAGRELEDVIDTAIDQIAQSAAQPKPQGPQQPPVDQTKIAVAQIEASTAQMQDQGETQRAQMQAQLKQQELGLKAQETQAKLYALPYDPQPQVAV